MATSDVQIKIELQGSSTTLDQLKAITSALGKVGQSAQSDLSKIEKSSKSVGDSFLSLKNIVAGLAIGAGIKTIVQEAMNFENALIGLQSVANNTGQSIDETTRAVTELTSDGLIPVTDVALSLKTLMATGLNIKQSVELFKSLREAASFNRLAFYDLGGAIVATTEGIKNDNSNKADAVGITKNLSNMTKEYAASINTTVGKLTQAQKIQAYYTGFVKEAALYQGDYNKLQESFSGSISRVYGELRILLIELGKIITQNPIVTSSINVLSEGLKTLRLYVVSLQGSIKDFILKVLIVMPDIIDDIVRSLEVFATMIGVAAVGAIVVFRREIIAAGIAATQSLATITASAFSTVTAFITLQGVMAGLGIGALIIGLGYLANEFVKLKEEVGSWETLFKSAMLSVDLMFLEASKSVVSFFEAFYEGTNQSINAINNLTSKLPSIGDSLQIPQLNTDGFKNSLSTLDEMIESVYQENNKLVTQSTAVQKVDKSIYTTLQEQLLGLNKEIKKNKKPPKIDVPVVVNANELKKKLEEAFSKATQNPFKILFDLLPNKGVQELQKNFNAGFKTMFGVDIESEFGQEVIGSAVGFVKSLTGGAKAVVGAVANGLGTLMGGPAMGQLFQGIVDFLGADPETFKKMITDLITQIPQILVNMIVNLAGLLTGRLIKDGITQLINNIPTIIRSLITAMASYLASPAFWMDVAFSAAGAFIASIPEIIQGFIDGFKDAGNNISQIFKNQFTKDLVKGLADAGEYIVNFFAGLWSGFGDLLGQLENGFKKIFSFFSLDLFKNLGKAIFDGFKAMLDIFNPVNLFKKLFHFDGGGKGVIEKFLGMDFPFVAFSKGGVVPGRSRVSGDSSINDIVPALLSAGEIVIPKSYASRGTQGVLDFMETINTPPSKKFSIGGGSVGISVGGGGVGVNIGGIGGSIGPGGISTNTGIGAIDNFASTLSEGWQQLSAKLQENLLPSWMKEILASLRRIGASVNITDFILHPTDVIKNAVASVRDTFLRPPIRKALTVPKMATGGEIPRGFNRDNFPSMLSSGEYVIDRSTTTRLKDFLESTKKEEPKTTDVLLGKVLELLQKPIQSTSTVDFNGRTLAQIMVELNRTNTRIA